MPANLVDTQWIFVDLDGTLADSLPGLTTSIAAAFAACGRAMPQLDLRPFIGPGIRTILQNLSPDVTVAEIDVMEKAFRASYDTSGVLMTELFPGAVPILHALRQGGCELFVVTNKPKLATATLLEKFQLTGLFTEVLSRNSRQPPYGGKAEMLHELILHQGADPANSLMVGDTAEDLEAALSCGVPFVHAAYGYGTIPNPEVAAIATLSALLDICCPPSRRNG